MTPLTTDVVGLAVTDRVRWEFMEGPGVVSCGAEPRSPIVTDTCSENDCQKSLMLSQWVGRKNGILLSVDPCHFFDLIRIGRKSFCLQMHSSVDVQEWLVQVFPLELAVLAHPSTHHRNPNGASGP